MELTGKAKKDFFKWFKIRNKYNEVDNIVYFFIIQDKLLQNALIIEWFNSVEYDKISSLWDYCFYGFYKGLRDYKQATEQAIIKANEIYNEKTS